MNKIKKAFSIFFCGLIIMLSCVVIGSAYYTNSVDLVKGKSAAYSDSHFAYGGFVNNTTYCHDVSAQKMRVQFEYRTSYSLSWISDARIFVAAGASAPFFKSSQFSSGKHFRLALSPEDTSKKTVSGVGRIYYYN